MPHYIAELQQWETHPLYSARLALDGFLVQHKREVPEGFRMNGLHLQWYLHDVCRPASKNVDFYIKLAYMYIEDGHKLREKNA